MMNRRLMPAPWGPMGDQWHPQIRPELPPCPHVRCEAPSSSNPRKDGWLLEEMAHGRWKAPPAPPTSLDPYRTGAGMAELIKAEFQV